jgi:hypothetical protein
MQYKKRESVVCIIDPIDNGYESRVDGVEIGVVIKTKFPNAGKDDIVREVRGVSIVDIRKKTTAAMLRHDNVNSTGGAWPKIKVVRYRAPTREEELQDLVTDINKRMETIAALQSELCNLANMRNSKVLEVIGQLDEYGLASLHMDEWYENQRTSDTDLGFIGWMESRGFDAKVAKKEYELVTGNNWDEMERIYGIK